MATKLRLKKSSVVGKKPEASDLDYGELAINYQDGNLYYKNADNDVKSLQESPVEFTARNESGFPVTKGQAVYINGVSGSTPTIALADADNASAMPAFGLLKASASNNAEVIIITSGNDVGLDTSSFAVGDTLYVSTTPGAITNVKPAGEASFIQNIGKVVRSHASEGIIKVGGAGRTAATPNLNTGNIFIGNDSNYASTTSMQTETRKHIVSGTGVGYDSASGVISIGQDVGTTSDVTFGKVTGDSGDFDIIKLNTTQWTDVNVPDNLPTFQEGNLFYFQGPDALTYSNHKINVKVGQDEITRVYNNTGSTIAKGQAVYVTGATNDFPTIALARANSFNTVYETMGLTSNEILNGEFGYVTVRGLFGGLNTTAFSPGDIVHVSPDDPGTLVNYSPTYPNFAYEVGVVLVSDSASGGNVGGCIQVNPHSEIVETLRGIGETRFDGDLTVAGSLTVLGSQTTVGQSNVTQGAPFYRLNEGDAIGEAGTTFTGSGLDDAFFAGHFTGPSEQSYYVRIDGVGTGTAGVDTFKVALGNDSAFASPILTTVDITGSAQLIHSTDNISVDFTATTGHTLNDTWKGTASPINVDTGFFTNRNTGTSGVGYTHMGFFFDASDEKWKVIDEYDSVPTGIIEVTDSSLGILVADTFEGSFTGNLTGSASQFGGLNTTQFLRSDTADTKTSGDLSFSDNVKAVFGASSDLQIYHDGSNSIISDVGTGNLELRGTNLRLTNAGGTELYLNATQNGDVDLYYDAAVKLSTTATGIDVTGNMVSDGLSVSSGGNTLSSTGNNLEFNRASGSSFIDQVGSGGSLTFRTTSSQTNRLKIENNGDINFYDSVGSGAELVWDTSALYLNAKDGVKSTYGDTNDLQIYHDGSNSYIDDQGTGRLYVKASDLYIQDGDGDDMIRAEGGNNGVKLYHNGIQKLETTSSGIDVSGNIAVSGTVDGRDIATDGTKLDTIDTNANNYSHPNHSGEVTSTGDGATVIADNVVDEANLKVSNTPTNGYFLSAQSGNTGGLTWAAVPPGYADSDVGAYIAGNRTYGNITTTGYIAGPATMTIDPAAVGDNTGTLVIAGNLQVDGTTTTINSTTMEVDDLNLTLASGAANAAAANGAGITIDGASATITYDGTNDEWDFNKNVNVTGDVYSSGNVGIGEASPDYRLEVKGTATTNTDIVGFSNSNGTVKHIFGLENVGAGRYSILDASNNTAVFFSAHDADNSYVDAGNFGIGTTSPSRKLVVYDGSAPYMAFQNSSTGTAAGDGLQIQMAGLDGYVFNYESGDLYLGAGGATRATIKGDGRVGIGTTSPQSWAKLEVAGSAGAQTGANQAFYVRAPTATANEGVGIRLSAASGSHEAVGIIGMVNNATGNAGSMTFHTYNLGATIEEQMRIDNTGNVGIGTTNPVANLVVSNAGAEGWEIDPGLIGSNHNRITNFNRATSQYCNLTTDALGFNYRISGSANAGLSMTANGLESKSASYNILNVRTDMDDNGSSDDGIIKITNGSSNTTKAELRWDESEDLVHISYGDHGRHISINSSGNVGIGTGSTSPQGVLDLGSTSLARSITWSKYNNIYSSYSEGSLNLTSNYYGNTSANDYKTSSTATYGAAGIEISGTGGTSNSGIIQFFVDPQTAKTADAAFVPTERMRITSAGNVGIGTETPQSSSKLHVNKTLPTGTLHYDGYSTVIVTDTESRLQLMSTDGGTNASTLLLSNGIKHWGLHHHGPTGSNVFSIGYRTSAATGEDIANNLSDVFNITTGGNVGIGETSPSSGISSNETTLHVSDANVPALVLDNTASFGDKYAIYANTQGNLKFLNVDTNYTGIQITDNDTVQLSGHVDHTDGSRQMVGNISTSSTSQTVLTSFTRQVHSGGEIMIIAIEATTKRRHITKLLVIQDADGDNTSGPIATEYGTMATDGNLFSVDVGTAGTAIRVNVTPTTTNSLTFRYKMDLLED